jgi:cold shock protein
MATGKIKWFDRGTGYGFIQPDDATENVFFHQSALQGQSHHTLELGARVSFKTEASERGPEAIVITVVTEA